MTFVESIRAEYLVYKVMGERSFAQLSDDQLNASLSSVTNSIAAIVWHISGNLKSRFTEFLTTDGEKEWRNREEEFEQRTVTRQPAEKASPRVSIVMRTNREHSVCESRGTN